MNGHKLSWAKEWLKEPKRLWIGGEPVAPASGKKFVTVNPADRTVLAEISEAGSIDVDSAVQCARQAFTAGAWPALSRRERASRLQQVAALLRKHRAEFATLEALDNGKTYREAWADDLPEAADVFDYYAGWIDKFYAENCPVEKGFVNFTRHEPLGVCALVVPWNFPLLLAAWKIAPALAMGNTVIVKPSPFTPLTLLRLAEWVAEAKILPPGVLNVLTGGAECGEALSRHAGIDKISFTGSSGIGRKVVEGAAASNLKAVTLELGGKSPNIIFADASNLDSIIDRSFAAMFSHKGEKCSEPTRLLVEASIYDRVAGALVEKAQRVRCGDPFDPKTEQGPQCHEAHFDKVMSYIRLGKEEGARLLTGGVADTQGNNAKGLFIRPTIFGECDKDMRISREEIFGPVLALFRFDDEAEAIRLANDSPYGLAAGFYTNDANRVHRVSEKLDAGMVFVNHYGCYDFASPFGGFKESGWGKEMAIHSLSGYTRLKSIWIRYQ